MLRGALLPHSDLHATVSGTRRAFRRMRRSLLTPCWQQAFDRKGAGKLTGFRLLFERKLP
jgi:hypothetical protein